MAAAQLLATGSGAASSGDIVVGATPLTIALRGELRGAIVNITLKDEVAAYNVIGVLTQAAPSTVLSGPGTYQVTRLAASSACGVFNG